MIHAIVRELELHIGEALPSRLYITSVTPVTGGVLVKAQDVRGRKFERTARSPADVRAILWSPALADTRFAYAI